MYILTSKCASRHNGVHFFDIATSKMWSDHGVLLYILTSKCASRHNGVHFFISHLASWLRTRRFSDFSILRSPKSLEKHSVSQLSYLFSHLHLLSSYSFSSTLLSSNLSLLSASSLLCFASVHIVGSLTSKLPSIMHRIRKEHSSSEMKLRTIGSTWFHHPERQPFDFPFHNPFSSKLQLNIRHFAALNHVSCDFWDPVFMPWPWLSCAAFATATGAKLTGIGALAKTPSACRKG